MTQCAAALDAENSLPWGKLIDTADIPGGGRLHLYRRDDEYEILFGEDQLMGSWAFLSEQALARLVAERHAGQVDRVLIGGLGMGFTLGAARAAFGPAAQLVVAELVPQVVAWARGPLSHIVGNSLTDPRVTIEVADVHDLIVEGRGCYDAILLDVDNGPNGLIQLANERLYCDWGLKSAHAALRPDGMLAVWSAYPDEAFGERLASVGFAVETIRVHGGEDGNPPHVIWLATKIV